MADTSIEWTNKVWNPTVGCSKVSEGCRNCYAMVMAARIANAAQAIRRLGRQPSTTQAAYLRVVRWQRGGMDPADDHDKALPEWNGRVVFLLETALAVLNWRKPRRIFVNSMSDIFHPNVTDNDVALIFAAMAAAPQHTFQVLTKRPERMAALLSDERWVKYLASRYADFTQKRNGGREPFKWPLPNVWLGTSTEDQRALEARLPHLLATPAAVRFLSCEPLLGPLDLQGACLRAWADKANNLRGLLEWVIIGGESGNHARRMDLDWGRSLVAQCKEFDVKVFFKQVGTRGAVATKKGGSEADIPADLLVRQFPQVDA